MFLLDSKDKKRHPKAQLALAHADNGYSNRRPLRGGRGNIRHKKKERLGYAMGDIICQRWSTGRQSWHWNTKLPQ